jgi:acetyl/propionyl-CoA carboxylase alpha subunit
MRIAVWTAGIFAAMIATLFCAGMLRIFAMSTKLDVIEARQVMVLEDMKYLRATIRAEDYVTRDEFTDWIRSSVRAESVRRLSRDERAEAATAAEIRELRERSQK